MTLAAITFFYSSLSFAQIARLLQITGTDAYLMRDQAKISLSQDMELEEGDVISSQSSLIQIQLYPSSQMNIAPQTEIKLTSSSITEEVDVDVVDSVIEYIKGIIRVNVSKDSSQKNNQVIRAQDVAFAVRGTEFEISSEEDQVDLDVEEGEVEVSSPHVQTFVPEVVKRGEGFRFDGKQKTFNRRKLLFKFKNSPRFKDSQELISKWKEKRSMMREKAKERRQLRNQGKEKFKAIKERRKR